MGSLACRQRPQQPEPEPESSSSTATTPRSEVEVLDRPGDLPLEPVEATDSEHSEPEPDQLLEVPRPLRGELPPLPEGCVRGHWTGFQVYPGELRFYAVWSVRGHPQLTGIHWSRDTRAYHGLVRAGGSYRSLRWRRCDSLQEASEVFRAEAAEKNLGPNFSYVVLGWP